MNNVWVITLLFWPGVVVLCAGINMLISWTFSWQEIILDLIIAVLAGYFLYAGAHHAGGHPGLHGVEAFFLVFSHGVFGWIWASSAAFRKAVGDPTTFIWMMAGIRVGATLWTAALDRASVEIGAKLDAGPFFFSLLVAPAKLLFSLVTSAVGMVIWVAGVFWAIIAAIIRKTKEGKPGATPGPEAHAGFAGGIFFTEFKPGPEDPYATTLGFTVHTWYGNTPLRHELYHTRQYIYLSDWLIPMWCVGLLWSLIAQAIDVAKKRISSVSFYQATGPGNPIEIPAYKL